MPHITLPEGSPGIRSLFAYSMVTAKPLCQLAETLLREPTSTLTAGERELIASYVSHLNACHYCTTSHSAFAAEYLNDAQLVEQVKTNPETAPISSKMKALLKIAAKVQQGGKSVTTADIEAAKKCEATEKEIHDTVLIAAAFCMFNRYVDGLATWAPPVEDGIYKANAEKIVSEGYMARFN